MTILIPGTKKEKSVLKLSEVRVRDLKPYEVIPNKKVLNIKCVVLPRNGTIGLRGKFSYHKKKFKFFLLTLAFFCCS